MPARARRMRMLTALRSWEALRWAWMGRILWLRIHTFAKQKNESYKNGSKTVTQHCRWACRSGCRSGCCCLPETKRLDVPGRDQKRHRIRSPGAGYRQTIGRPIVDKFSTKNTGGKLYIKMRILISFKMFVVSSAQNHAESCWNYVK